MTIDELFERIEHVTAGLAEQTKSHHEEARELWRDTQRQLDRLTTDVDRLAIEGAKLALRMDERDQSSHDRDKKLGDRIDSLGSAIGEFIAASKRGLQ